MMVVTLGQQFSVLFALTRRAMIQKMRACNPTEHPPTQFCNIFQNVYSWERYVVTVPSALYWFRFVECFAVSTSNNVPYMIIVPYCTHSAYYHILKFSLPVQQTMSSGIAYYHGVRTT